MIEFEIEKINLVSTNDMYIPRPCKGGKHAYITRSTALKSLQAFMEKNLVEKLPDDVVTILNEELKDYGDDFAIKLKVAFYLPSKNFKKEDTSNYIKALEDCITKRTGIDDCKNVELSLKKFLTENDYMSVKVRLESYRISSELGEDWWIKTL